MIASVSFRNYKALRSTSVSLTPFNLVIGPNGSGKTSLIEALLRLRTLAALPPSAASGPAGSGRTVPEAAGKRAGKSSHEAAPQIEIRFATGDSWLRAPASGGPDGSAASAAPRASNTESAVVTILCGATPRDDRLTFDSAADAAWPGLRDHVARIRAYMLDHTTMAAPSPARSGRELAVNGSNLAAVLGYLRLKASAAFSALTAEVLRILPEFRSLELDERADGRVELGLRLADDGLVTPSEMSQGMLYLLAMLALSFAPNPPPVLCIEDVDRGIHPRMLREVRDALYRLSYPQSFGLERPPVQVIATTHSPYFIDLFREHPEEVIITQKRGRAAVFERLSDRPDLPELMREGSLGDMWFSGILGGVPDDV